MMMVERRREGLDVGGKEVEEKGEIRARGWVQIEMGFRLDVGGGRGGVIY